MHENKRNKRQGVQIIKREVQEVKKTNSVRNTQKRIGHIRYSLDRLIEQMALIRS